MTIRTEKTVYDKPEREDGVRILVMRMWPRGVSKGKVDLWLKELGTDKELIHLWKDGKIKWDEFSRRYIASLKGKEAVLKGLAARSRKETVTLLCTDRDQNRCHRSLLRREIEKLV